jgi:hypothetical protein
VHAQPAPLLLPPGRRTPAAGAALRERSPAEPAGRDAPDRGVGLLLVFTASMLAIVALVVLVGAVDTWWILVPAMGFDFAVTGTVLFAVARLLDEPE